VVQQTLTVSAAVSLSDVLEEIGEAYERTYHARVRFNLAGSNALARQIANGAPVDVFISADEAQMVHVERAGRIAPGSRFTVAANQLAVVSAPERARVLAGGLPSAARGIRRLAIGDPAAVPAGVYARAYLERKNLWGAYRDHIVPTANVRAALAAVENSTADAAIVYATDARRSTRAVIAFRIPIDETPFIGYQAAVVARSRHPEEAQRFLAFLRSEEGVRIFASHGFLPVPPGR
jgi:molybdate transport system substrate-binding protein